MLFAKDELKPRFWAVNAGSNAREEPASAPAPNELTEVRASQSLIRSRSRAKACACLANS